MVVAAPALPAEVERALIRDITVAADAHAKEGDTFFLITTRSTMPLCSPFRCILIPVDLLPDSIPVRVATLGRVPRGARSFFPLLAGVVCWWRNASAPPLRLRLGVGIGGGFYACLRILELSLCLPVECALRRRVLFFQPGKF